MARSPSGPFGEALGFCSSHCHAVRQAELSEPGAPAALEETVGEAWGEGCFPCGPGSVWGPALLYPPSTPPSLGPGPTSASPTAGPQSAGREGLNVPFGEHPQSPERIKGLERVELLWVPEWRYSSLHQLPRRERFGHLGADILRDEFICFHPPPPHPHPLNFRKVATHVTGEGWYSSKRKLIAFC